MLSELATLKKVEKYLRPLNLETHQYQQVMNMMEDSMRKGLSAKSDLANDLKMYITYVRSLPDGTECGNFLALDLGGTNFRVLLISLDNGGISMQSCVYGIPESIMLGTGTQLFDHIAACIRSFLEAEGLENEEFPLGFTFSFPCKQEGLTRSILVNWTKGFKCTDVEGEDVVKLLEDAVARKNLKVKCYAVINDTVGTLMTCAHEDKNCQIGVIFGTGTNACYLEDLQKVEKWEGDNDASKHLVINTEWGAFGNNGALKFITTEFDKGCDDVSKNPGEQIYEKMTSGMYLGEIVRQIIIKLAEEGCIFGGHLSSRMRTPMRFLTKYISEIESDQEFDMTNVRMVLEDMGIESYTIVDCLLMREICKAVSNRAACLAAAGVAAILKRLGQKYVTIAVDGSLYRYHPNFHNRIQEMTKNLVPDIQFKLALSNDGSGVGAALVAAVALKKSYVEGAAL